MSEPDQQQNPPEQDKQTDLEVSAETAEGVTGGAGNNKVVTNPPPALSASME